MTIDRKQLALDPSDHELLDSTKKDVLYSRIAKYVAVRRDRGELMKAIVPAAAKHFRVRQGTITVAVRIAREKRAKDVVSSRYLQIRQDG